MSQRPEIPKRAKSLHDPVLRVKVSSISGRSEESDESLTSSLKEVNKKDALTRQSLASLNSSVDRLDWFRLLGERVHHLIDRVNIKFARQELKLAAGKLSNEEFEDRKDVYFDEIASLTTQLIDILNRTVRISCEPSHNREFVNLLESKVSPKIKRRSNSTFKDRLIKAYNAEDPNDPKDWQGVMNIIFGPALSDNYTLDGVKNGRLLDPQIEEQFDSFNLIIVPHAEGQGRWILRIMDHALLKHRVGAKSEVQKTFQDIDGQELEFTNDHRPAARFLYLHYTLALLRAMQTDRNSNQKGVMKELYEDMPVWASPSKYLTENMLLSVAEKAGQAISKFYDFSAHSLGLNPEDPNISMKELDEILDDEELYDVFDIIE